MDETLLIQALLKGGPAAVAVLAFGFAVWKWILPAIREIYEARAKIAASEFDRTESARKSRDEAWQSTLREIGIRHEAAITKVVDGHEKTLDRVIALATTKKE